MFGRIAIAAVVITTAGTNAAPTYAQVAAEEAVIVSGTSAGTGRASRGLGNAVRGSINGATRTIRTIPRSAPRGAPRRGRSGAVIVDGPLAADSDPLENTDAPAYELSNGATIRVSGRLRNSTSARCKLNCPDSAEEDDGVAVADETAAEDTQIEQAASEAQEPVDVDAETGEAVEPDAETPDSD